MLHTLLAGLLVTTSGEIPSVAERLKTESLVIQADEVHCGNGEVYRPGTIVILDGDIVAVGKNPGLPLSSRVVECQGITVSPGLVDAACQLGPNPVQGFSEQSSEVIPHLDIRDSVDLNSRALERLAREGVTTVYVTPEAASVIGSRAAVVKTGGRMASRFVEAPPSIKTNLANESWSRGGFNRTPSNFSEVTFFVRRPTTRMGSTWVWRKAFYDALRFAEKGSSDGDPEAMAALGKVLSGEVGLRVQARQAHDIYTAQRLCDEFGIQRHVLEYCIEAHRALPFLAEHKTPVVFGPLTYDSNSMTENYEGGRGSSLQPCLSTPRQLLDAGVPFCLTACEQTGEGGLARQAGAAIRFGLDADEALASVTSSAAKLLGIEDQVGLVQSGRDADLVFWNGPPLQDTSRVVAVLVDGKVVRDDQGWFRDAGEDNGESTDQ